MGKMNLNRMLSAILAFLLAMQIVIVWIFGSFGTWIGRQQEERSVDYILKMYRTNLDKALNKIENDLQDILSNQLTLEMLNNRSDLQRWHASYNLISLLKEKRLTTQDVDGYIISDNVYQTFLMSRGHNISYEDMDFIQRYFQNLDIKGIISSGWTSALIEDKGYLVKYYNYGGVMIAAVLSQTKIQQILSYGQDTDTAIEFFVTDAKKEIICSSNPTWKYGQGILENTAPVLREQKVMDGAYYVMGSLQSSGLGMQTPYFFIILLLMVVSVLLLILLRYFMNKEVIRPVKVLSCTSEKIRQGSLDVRPDYICRNKEMLELKDTYIMMLDTIMELKVQQYEKVIQVKDSELKYMHMQLKPHFFLNALSTINSMAYRNKNEQIHEFIQVFSDNIRYMFRAGLHTVCLREEIAHVNKYLEMQRLLYKDSFYYYFEMPEELEEYQIPRMILHTFMENIFKHVIDINSFTTIFLVCSMDTQQGAHMLKIEVQNTGKHFENRILQEINENNGIEPLEKDKSGIGLKHTKEILSIMYGQEHLLYLENEEPDIAKVTVWIPKKVIREFGVK
ncbi:sensor histidine kinase [Blautia producta]|uniref:sensor histidine kinase n=1 Tax=Blautia producta TaxID=33035 RepID=UPI0031B5A00F